MAKRLDRDGLYTVPSSPYWYASFKVNGHRYRRSTGKKKKADAAVRRAEMMVEKGGTPPADAPRPKGMAFERAAEIYVEHRLAQGKGLGSYHALDGYRKKDGEQTASGIWVDAFRGRPIRSIRSEEIEDLLGRWQTEKGWSNATRNNRLNQLSGLLSYAYGRKWIDQHPTEKGRVPKLLVENARERWLRSDELERLIDQAEDMELDHLVPFVRFAVATGMRLSEVCGLHCHDLEYDDQRQAFVTVRNTKNKRPVCWPLEGDVLDLVERQVEAARFPHSYIFPGPRGASYKTSAPRHLKRAAVAAGIEWGCTRTGFTTHSLRRTMASMAADDGVPRDQIQKAGNWKTATMVDRYAMHADPTLRKTAARLSQIAFGKREMTGDNEKHVTVSHTSTEGDAEAVA